MIKIATLNLCLGLKNKRDLIKDILVRNKIDILALQETELEPSLDLNLVNIAGYKFESEINEYKQRVGFYIKNIIDYRRCPNLEGINNNLIIIDVLREKNSVRIMNIYRSFNPPTVTAKELFTTQCDQIRSAFVNNTVVLGDFNLDYNKRNDVSYANADLFEIFDERLDDLNLFQLIKFNTDAELRES